MAELTPLSCMRAQGRLQQLLPVGIHLPRLLVGPSLDEVSPDKVWQHPPTRLEILELLELHLNT